MVSDVPDPDWPHAPVHRLEGEGAYFVTCGTYRKQRLLSTPERLTLVHDALLSLAQHYGWELQAWAVLANHYHFVALSPGDPKSLRTMLSHLHTQTARELNLRDGTPGRRVWYQYRDTQLTYQASYLARVRYANENATHHGVVRVATRYPWCSAAWFAREADPAFRKVVESFKIDRLNVYDDY